MRILMTARMLASALIMAIGNGLARIVHGVACSLARALVTGATLLGLYVAPLSKRERRAMLAQTLGHVQAPPEPRVETRVIRSLDELRADPTIPAEVKEAVAAEILAAFEVPIQRGKRTPPPTM